MTEHIWVIEWESKGKWYPTTGINLNRKNARIKKRYWQASDTDGKYRVKKYERKDD